MYDLYKKADYRQIITIKCPVGMSQDELKKWWFARAERVKKLSGLKWYTLCFPLDCSPFGEPAFDGYEEMWFGSFDDLNNAYESRLMKTEMKDISDRGLDAPELFQAGWLEENIVTLKGYDSIPKNQNMIRLTGICKLPPSMTKKDLKDWFYQHAARVIDKDGFMLVPGIRWYTHCFAIDSPFGTPKIDGCAENWWETLAEIKRDFDSEIMQSQLDDREENIDIADPSYFQGIWAEEFIIDIKNK